MSEYRGVLKVAGSTIRGWLIDSTRPERRVRFDLVIDNEVRGTYAANRRRRFLIRQSGSAEDTHGFSIPIRRIWITGKTQHIALIDPTDASLSISLAAKLGPAANSHFEDHVVSGQISIGDAEPAPRQKQEAADDDSEPRPLSVNKALLRQIRALNDLELINLLSTIDRDVVLERLRSLEAAVDWHAASAFRRLLMSPTAEQRLLALGRVAMKSQNHGIAARANSAAAAMHPQSFDANLMAGIAKAAQGEFDDALNFLRAADRVEQGTVRAKREMVAVLTRQLRGELGADRREDLRAEHLSLLRGLSASKDPAVQMAYRVPLATALYNAGRYDEAIAVADAILVDSPHDPKALMIKARALVARNQIAEAHALYQRILEFDPGHRGAKMNLRVLAALAEDEAHHPAASNSLATPPLYAAPDPSQAGQGGELARYLNGLSHTWICTTKNHGDDDLSPELQGLLDAHAARRLGFVEIGLADGRRLEFWRRDALLGLAESGLLNAIDDAVALNRWKSLYGVRERNDPVIRAKWPRRRIAALVSRNGGELYGGGEHFLVDAADHHARQGFEPIIVGVRPELRGEERPLNGYRCMFVGDSVAEMRKILFENDVSIVHGISGVGFLIAQALNFTNVSFIYGVHFWNELLGDPQYGGYFDNVTDQSRFRREFLLILSRAASIYANSRFTQKIVEEGFGVRCPIVYPVPNDRIGGRSRH
jgi:tetratricopeptide (TPR) repeat protein